MARDARSLEVRLTAGRANSLGEADEIVKQVLEDSSRLPELFDCLFSNNEWVRMRSGDALEKICRVQPAWFRPYRTRLLGEVADIGQASVQWHLAQMLGEIDLTSPQRQKAISILSRNLANPDVDWIVASHSMETLARFAHEGSAPVAVVVPLLQRQRQHRSKAVAKRASKLLAQFEVTKEFERG